MPTFEVVGGDTVWGLTRRALTEQLGRRPTNAEILEIVNRVQVPSGNVDLIFPGEQITIPVGPGYGPDIQEDPDSFGVPPVAPGDAVNAPPGGRPDDWQNPARPRTPSPGGAENAPIGGRPDDWQNPATAADTRRFAPPLFGRGAFDSFGAPDNQVGDYRDFNAGSLGDWGDLLREVVGDVGMFVGRGVGRVPVPRPGLPVPRPGLPALPSGARPALPSGARPALPAGPAGGYPAAGGGRMPFQFGPGPAASPARGAAARTRFPSENEIRALRQPQTRGFR